MVFGSPGPGDFGGSPDMVRPNGFDLHGFGSRGIPGDSAPGRVPPNGCVVWEAGGRLPEVVPQAGIEPATPASGVSHTRRSPGKLTDTHGSSPKRRGNSGDNDYRTRKMQPRLTLTRGNLWGICGARDPTPHFAPPQIPAQATRARGYRRHPRNPPTGTSASTPANPAPALAHPRARNRGRHVLAHAPPSSAGLSSRAPE